MSERNYRRARKEGVTGPHTNTCFPAALDRITPHATIGIDTYEVYDAFTVVNEQLPKRQRNGHQANMYNVISQDLGLDSWRDFGFELVETPRQLKHLLRKCFLEGTGVVLDIEGDEPEVEVEDKESNTNYNHSVGVVPLSVYPEAFTLRSTWVPKELQGVLEPEDVFDHLFIPNDPSKRYNFSDTNITIIPRA